MLQQEDRNAHFCNVIDRIEKTFDLTAKEWCQVIMYIYTIAKRKHNGNKVLHHHDVSSRLHKWIAEHDRGIFPSEGESQTPSR